MRPTAPTLLLSLLTCLGCQGEIGEPETPLEPILPPDERPPPVEDVHPIFQIEPEGAPSTPGIRGLTHTELERTLFDVTGVRADVSDLPANVEEYYLQNDAGRLTVRDGAAMRTLLRIATEVAAEADVDALLPCAAECTDDELRRYLRRAFTEELSAPDFARYREIYDRASATLTAEEARRAVVQASLFSPKLLYRTEIGEGGELTPPELAKKLSYFLWGRPPDDALRDDALTGALGETFASHVDRMLEHPNTRERLVELVFDWLAIDHLDLQSKVAAEELPPALEDSMREEAERLVARELFDENNGLRSLFTTDTSFVDALLAEHVYDLEGDFSAGFREVSLEGTGRRGLLTTAAVLTAHSKELGRSPMQRGHFLVAEVMCLGFGPEFGEVTAQLPDNPGDITFREQFAELQTTQPCNNCHRTLNAGFAFDLYDNVGRRWDPETVPDSEAAGHFTALPYDRVEFDSPADAVEGIATHPLLTRCFVGQAYRYAQGTRSRDPDASLLMNLEAAFDASEGDVLDLLRSIALSTRFSEAAVE